MPQYVSKNSFRHYSFNVQAQVFEIKIKLFQSFQKTVQKVNKVSITLLNTQGAFELQHSFRILPKISKSVNTFLNYTTNMIRI